MTDHHPGGGAGLYSRQYLQVFAAVFFFMGGVSLQFHFGQYVAFLGYGVDTLGQILSAGVVGTLLVRLHLGRWIDRFGCRRMWLLGSAMSALSVVTMQFTTSLWQLVALRLTSTISMAAVMTTVAVFAAHMAPRHRRTESIGIMGLAGFVGMMAGPTLGDWIFSGDVTSITPYRMFFWGSALCSLSAFVIILFMPNSPTADGHESNGQALSEDEAASEPILRTVWQFWPGAILLVGVVFSLVFCWQASYLERLAEKRGFHDIKVFFLVYCPTAITLRLLFRRLPEQLGRTRTVVGGLTLQAIGICSLVGITSEWGLVFPALVMGAGHCFVFPSMVDLAAERLPYTHRGMGTSLILGAGDVGNMIGFFLMGEVIDRYGFDTCLWGLAGTLLFGAGVFAYLRRHDVIRKRESA